MSKYPLVPLTEMADIHDNLREPVSEIERNKMVGLYPYYGATGQIGTIDGFRQDGKYVLLGEDGAPFLDPNKPKAYIVEGKCWVNNHAHVLKGKHNICDDEYLCIALNFADYSNAVTGSTRLKLPQNMMGNLLIPKPSIDEQKEIAKQYLTQLAEIEKAREATEVQRQELKQLKKIIRQSAFNDLLEKYERSHLLRDVCIISAGGTPSRGNSSFFSGTIPWLKTLDLNFGLVTDTQEKISEDAFKSIRGELLPKGTVLVAMYGGAGTIGKSGILGIEACTNQAIAALQPKPNLLTCDFLHEWLCFIRSEWMQYSSGNRKDPNINKAVVENMTIPLPPINEQILISSSIKEALNQMRILEEGINIQYEEIRSLPNKILAQTFQAIENE